MKSEIGFKNRCFNAQSWFCSCQGSFHCFFFFQQPRLWELDRCLKSYPGQVFIKWTWNQSMRVSSASDEYYKEFLKKNSEQQISNTEQVLKDAIVEKNKQKKPSLLVNDFILNFSLVMVHLTFCVLLRC